MVIQNFGLMKYLFILKFCGIKYHRIKLMISVNYLEL